MPTVGHIFSNPEKPSPKVNLLRRRKEVRKITQEWGYKEPIIPLSEYGIEQLEENTLHLQSMKMPQMSHSADPKKIGNNTLVVSLMIPWPNTKEKTIVSAMHLH